MNFTERKLVTNAGPGRPAKYPFEDLESWQCLEVECEAEGDVRRLRSAASAWGIVHEKTLTVRRISELGAAPMIYGVWLV